LKVTITNQATNQHTDQTLTIYQQTPSISIRVSNGGEGKLKIKGKMRDFLQGSHSHSGATLEHRNCSSLSPIWLICSRELMISLNLKRARKMREKERERLIRRRLGSDTDIREEREISGMREGNR
jgi:hypothetical protein